MTDSDRLAEIERCVANHKAGRRCFEKKHATVPETLAIARGLEERAERAEAELADIYRLPKIYKCRRCGHTDKHKFARDTDGWLLVLCDGCNASPTELGRCYDRQNLRAIARLIKERDAARAELARYEVAGPSSWELREVCDWHDRTLMPDPYESAFVTLIEAVAAMEAEIKKARAEADALRGALEVGVNGLGCAALDLDWGAERMRKAGLKHHKRLSRAAEYARENEAALASGTAEADDGYQWVRLPKFFKVSVTATAATDPAAARPASWDDGSFGIPPAPAPRECPGLKTAVVITNGSEVRAKELVDHCPACPSKGV